MKPLRDYQKIRSLVGWILRNKFFQGKRPNQAQVAYLQIGCGPQVAPGFINLDYRWVPGVDVVWDLNVPLPFPAQRFQGIFAEHVLEHLDDDTLLKVLKEALRILRPGGGLRIVVPSLEIYARRYLEHRTDTDEEPARMINRVFYSGHEVASRTRWLNDGHQFMHDFASLSALLRSAGFKGISRSSYKQGTAPLLLLDRQDREWESLYVEAFVPKS